MKCIQTTCLTYTNTCAQLLHLRCLQLPPLFTYTSTDFHLPPLRLACLLKYQALVRAHKNITPNIVGIVETT